MLILPKRPEDFYGFDDWTGGDPADDEARIERAQQAWDAAYARAPWLTRLLTAMGFHA